MDSGELAIRLDRVYVCKQCKASFIFSSDMTDHQATTNHSGIYEMLFDRESST